MQEHKKLLVDSLYMDYYILLYHILWKYQSDYFASDDTFF